MQLLCMSGHFSVITQVGVKPLDIARLLNMLMQRTRCFVFRVQVKKLRCVPVDLRRTNSTNVNYTGGTLVFNITKTRLYNVDPLQPHFYIAKLGFTGVYINFLISAQKHKLWVLVRTASARRF